MGLNSRGVNLYNRLMAIKRKRSKRRTSNKSRSKKNSGLTPERSFTIGKRTIRFIADRVIIFRLMRTLHGRFWGIGGLTMMLVGLGICMAIRPDKISLATAYSDFGSDVRTAPYLAGSLFFAAYGLWRWRNYLKHTLKHSRPVTSLVTLTVMGLYVAALFPVAWEPWPRMIHNIGVGISGVTMAAVVVVDTLLTKVRKGRSAARWRLLRLLSFMAIIIGGYITFGSNSLVRWYNLALFGELLMFAGYATWVIDKTYRGEGQRSALSRILQKLVIID